MAFPATLDAIGVLGPYLDTSPGHDAIHPQIKLLLEAVQAKVGIDGSANPSSLDYIAKAAMGPSKTYASGATIISASRVTADTNDRLQILADGSHKWGSGAAATDLTLARSGASLLAITGGLTATTDLSAQLGGVLAVIGAQGPASQAALKFGGDTTLYRSAAGALRTPGTLTVDSLLTATAGIIIQGAATIWSGSGAPAAGTGATGDYYFRTGTPSTSLQRIYVKTGVSTWTGIL